jgi:glycerophosphoryl diester phosphodiesterase
MPWEWERPPRVIGHRGSPHEATENTLASFQAATRHVRAVELDARLTADGEVVVHHDAELGRVVRGVGRVEEMTAEALVALGIPRLADVLALGLLVDVEMKADASNAAELPARVHEDVRGAGAQERVLVTSFDWELADAYAGLSGRPAGAIVPYAPERGEMESFPRLRFVALAQDAALPEVIAQLRGEDRDVLVWTVDDPTAARLHLDRGAAAVITDRPGPLARALRTGAPAG